MKTLCAPALLAVSIAACGGEPADPPSGGTGGATETGSGGSGGAGSAPAGGGTSGSAGTSGNAGSSGSGGAAQGEAGVAISFGQIRTLIPGTCGGNLCHTGRQKPSLANDANLYRTLHDTVVAQCGTAPLVMPGNPEGSAILRLVNRQCTEDGMPFYMPADCESDPCLPSSQIRTITSWIEAGAPGP